MMQEFAQSLYCIFNIYIYIYIAFNKCYLIFAFTLTKEEISPDAKAFMAKFKIFDASTLRDKYKNILWPSTNNR